MESSQEHNQRTRTKIVATVGPASSSPEMLARLIHAGVDVFRLNMAHGGPELQQPHVDNIRSLSERIGEPIAILADLAGPKIRLGNLSEDAITCELGAEFFFIHGAEPQAPNELTSTYAALVKELRIGDRVMLADGTVTMIVEGKKPGHARLRVVQQGVIRSRQGINLPGVKLSVPAISVTDHQHAIWAAGAGIDFVGLSFIRSPDEVRTLKDILRSCGSNARVVAKIEKREALDRLDEIVAEADAVMVARGDLGVEIDVAQMPIEQKRIIATCQRFQRPVIIATQMLDSMQESPRPTRAEATDVANAILDGADACMLSGETAIGHYPLETVVMMNRIAMATEASVQRRPPRDPEGNSGALHGITRAAVQAAGHMAFDLEAKLVFVASHSGRTALALSQHRSFVPTVGVSSSEETLRQMCLYWGVMPLRGAPATDLQGLIKHADEWACRVGFATQGDRIVIVGGSHLAAGPEDEEMAGGVHDIVLVHEVEGLASS
ncbi:MAG: pyruvate kinase [Planctomycetes bacterium]|nr:pyruvate kinase [Planctomycetota bacterium]